MGKTCGLGRKSEKRSGTLQINYIIQLTGRAVKFHKSSVTLWAKRFTAEISKNLQLPHSQTDLEIPPILLWLNCFYCQ